MPKKKVGQRLADGSMLDLGYTLNDNEISQIKEIPNKVPKTRKINNKELSEDITLTFEDLGELPVSIITLESGTINASDLEDGFYRLKPVTIYRWRGTSGTQRLGEESLLILSTDEDDATIRHSIILSGSYVYTAKSNDEKMNIIDSMDYLLKNSSLLLNYYPDFQIYLNNGSMREDWQKKLFFAAGKELNFRSRSGASTSSDHYIMTNKFDLLYIGELNDNGELNFVLFQHDGIVVGYGADSRDVPTPKKIPYNQIATLSDIPTDYVSFNAQTLTDEQKAQARTNIGAGTSDFSGSYNDLIDVPTDHITKDVDNLTNYTLSVDEASKIQLSMDNSTYVLTVKMLNSKDEELSSSTVDFPLESMVVSASYLNDTKEIQLTLKNGTTTKFSVADLVSGLQPSITSSNKLSSDLVDDTSSNNKFVTSTDKTNWNNKVSKSGDSVSGNLTLDNSVFLKGKPTTSDDIELIGLNEENHIILGHKKNSYNVDLVSDIEVCGNLIPYGNYTKSHNIGTPSQTFKYIYALNSVPVCTSAADSSSKSLSISPSSGMSVVFYNEKTNTYQGKLTLAGYTVYFDREVSSSSNYNKFKSGWMMAHFSGNNCYIGSYIPFTCSSTYSATSANSSSYASMAEALRHQQSFYPAEESHDANCFIAKKVGENKSIVLDAGKQFDITSPVYILIVNSTAGSRTSVLVVGKNTRFYGTEPWANLTIADAPIYLVGTLDGTTFTLDSTNWVTQEQPTSENGKVYLFVGNALGTTTINFNAADQKLFAYKDGKFGLYSNSGKTITDNSQLTNGAGYITPNDLVAYLPTKESLGLSAYESDNSSAKLYVGSNNEMNFGSNMNKIYIGYSNTFSNSSPVSEYYFGTHSGGSGQQSGDIYCGTVTATQNKVKIGGANITYDSTNKCVKFTFD